MGAKFRREFARFWKRVSEDIYEFCEEMKFVPTWQQRQLFDAVMRGDNKIAVKSGQGPGKSSSSSILGMWRLMRGENSKLIVTAPTMRQCKDVWLAEVRQHLERGNPIFRKIFKASLTNLGVMGKHASDWGCLLITATKSENAQGQHRELMDIICEEASGVSREIIEQFKGTLSNPDALFLMIGNPNTRDCAFFDCFHSLADKWTCFTWNAEETPASSWFDPQRNQDVADEFGRDSDVYRIRILGEFPHTDPNCIIDYYSAQKATDQTRILEASKARREDGTIARQFGIDVARFGGDESVVYRRVGNAIVEESRQTRKEPSELIFKAFAMQSHTGWKDDDCWYVCDAGGMGQGSMHLFYDHEKQIHEFHFNGKPYNPRKYANKITEAWFMLRNLLREQVVCIPDDNQLMTQLTTRQYMIDQNGRLIIEKKEKYIERQGHSPDRADALVMAFYEGVSHAQVT